jgi:AraC-like DNA-binding protein
MINSTLIEKLMPITDEEKKILDGDGSINRDLYFLYDKESIMNSKKLLSDGKSITVRAHTRFVHFPKHSHDYVEIIYMCSGSTTHIIDGKEVVLKEGELLLLCQSAVQEILPAGENDIAINFIVLPEYFDTVLGMLGEEDTPLRSFVLSCIKKNSGGGYLYFEVSDVLPIQNLIENLIWTLLNETPNKRNINQITMGLLFLQLINHSDRLDSGTTEEKITVKALRYIEKSYRTASLSELSKALHYDISALSREIKRKTGRNWNELLLEKRLSQACFLLKNTDMTVDEISNSVGYENKSFFYACFKKKYGISPRKYRLDKQPVREITVKDYNDEKI